MGTFNGRRSSFDTKVISQVFAEQEGRQTLWCMCKASNQSYYPSPSIAVDLSPFNSCRFRGIFVSFVSSCNSPCFASATTAAAACTCHGARTVHTILDLPELAIEN